MPALPKVYVLGANVDALTTAVLLLQKGYRVTLVADAFPGDKHYATSWNNTHWMTNASAVNAALQEDDSTSFRMLWKLALRKAGEAGVMIINAEHIDEATHTVADPWWKNVVPSFQWIPKANLPKHAHHAYNYTTVMIQPKRYLSWLQSLFLQLGGRRKRVSLQSALDAVQDDDQVDLVVNCLPSLDQHLRHRRGKDQIVQQWIIKASQIRKAVHIKQKDQSLYLYPQMDGNVVIGARAAAPAKGKASRLVDVHQLLRQLEHYCPELSFGKGIDAIDLVTQQPDVSRATQHEQPRVENQYLVTPLGRKIAITHNYGHEGYQSSWGASKRVVQLVHDAYTNLQREPKAITRLLSRL
ncbi:hypothetical protein BC940DRAFT_312775 [Gongronella butleri]|nr:hypothetical protein BC940DRAFT_312775 [Gongronella butleri]